MKLLSITLRILTIIPRVIASEAGHLVYRAFFNADRATQRMFRLTGWCLQCANTTCAGGWSDALCMGCSTADGRRRKSLIGPWPSRGDRISRKLARRCARQERRTKLRV
jgi:hypothetical protein